MRIRSIHPEFWRSEDVAAMDWETRLLFIGLWSYVDDNGVGRDVTGLIVGDLFSLDVERSDNPRDILETVSRGLQTLSDGGQITRYKVASKPLLFINAWEKWQRIDRPAKPRYEPPTCDDAVIRDTLATPSRHPRDSAATGEGEKGRRGEVEKTSSPTDVGALFDEFWQAYPRKTGKQAARKAWDKQRRKVDPTLILDGVRRLAADPNLPEAQFVPHPATWLNEGRWDDEPYPPRQGQLRAVVNDKPLPGGGWRVEGW